MRLRHQFGRFVAVGLVVVAFDFAVFVLLLALQVPRAWANVAGMTGGFLVGLAGHHRFTFQTGEPLGWPVALRYALGFLVNLALGVVTLELLVRFGLSELLSKLLTMGVIVASNFVWSRYFVFRQRSSR